MAQFKNIGFVLAFLAVLISSCSAPSPEGVVQVVTVYSTPATQPWLSDMYECANRFSAIIRLVDSPSASDIQLQVGEPKFLSSFAFQIDEEEILVVTHRQSPIQNLTLEETRTLFMGLGDPSVQMWVYASDADVQIVFDQFVMKGRSVFSSARVAVSAQQMSDVVNNEINAVGILPRHWKAGDIREVFSVGTLPVLAITQGEPQGAVNQLIGCLQK